MVWVVHLWQQLGRRLIYFVNALSVIGLASASLFLLVSLLVGLLYNLHCVFSDGPLCSLIFLVLLCYMFTVVFVAFLFPLMLLYLFNFSFHPEKGYQEVFSYLFNFFFLLKGGFPRILDRFSISEVVDLVMFLTLGSNVFYLICITLPIRS